jgi:hypothetical protein
MQRIGKGYLTGDEDCNGSAKHNLPDFEIISPNLPDSYEHEHGSKNDNRNVRRRVFLVSVDEPWHSHAQKKKRLINVIPVSSKTIITQSTKKYKFPNSLQHSCQQKRIIGMLGVVFPIQRKRKN